ncbi:hypothetical protein [Thauera humireducens]|uniref:hypothetical protein n=1 Tax=Thauera humireducens TaxID=1134435 RepID=UPI00311F3EA0
MLSGYPHLEEAWRFAELVFPLLPGKAPVRLRTRSSPAGPSTPARSRPPIKEAA